MGIFRKMRFFVSWLIFEKILKWEPVDVVVAEITNEVRKYNEIFDHSCCYNCEGDKFIRKQSGQDGLFSYVNHFYECTRCGNQQDDDGSRRRYNFKELRGERIIEDGDGQYRYYVLAGSSFDLVFNIMIAMFIISAGFFIAMFVYVCLFGIFCHF